ncbi:hypothetical protein SISSUDRAFT_1044283 [Sistotremastrum suecicum HHB10207 ss-3]|uniref:Uncharacterized protein n=1 Tax=Sistotremastrum suecicum HHB10207 ss-3 TaxID=1314776 RepID=A0A166F8B4_9AGAM|nr:hypothetical protein SISSUDRAFT_1044283 [Sistotremastrum suecicum HHB10207 ss-3]
METLRITSQDSEFLPSYAEAESSVTTSNIISQSNEGIRLEYNPNAHTHTSPPTITSRSPNRSTDYLPSTSTLVPSGPLSTGESLLYGSGACVPPTPDQRSTFDVQVLRRLNGSVQWMMPDRTVRVFDAAALYTSAISQIDMLLPLLSQSSSSGSKQRAITLHLPNIPQPSPNGRKDLMKRPRGRHLRDYDELEKFLSGVNWHYNHPKEDCLFKILDVMECIVNRIALEGFFVCEERWLPLAKVAQFVLLC